MTTAEALEGMPDAGQFEILAARSLRELDDDCRAVAHFGVNEAGKTIANPIDGFCRVPGSDPPRFVMPAFTLTAREGLERKWLFDHSTAPRAKTATAADDGDLIKAAREAAGIRRGGPHCLDQKLAFLRYTSSGPRGRDTSAGCLAGRLALVRRPWLRYIPSAGRNGGGLCWRATHQGIARPTARRGRLPPWPGPRPGGLVPAIGRRSYASENAPLPLPRRPPLRLALVSAPAR